jgi:hypothetical protein
MPIHHDNRRQQPASHFKPRVRCGSATPALPGRNESARGALFTHERNASAAGDPQAALDLLVPSANDSREAITNLRNIRKV